MQAWCTVHASAKCIGRKVVAPNQIRTITRFFRCKLIANIYHGRIVEFGAGQTQDGNEIDGKAG